MNFYGASGYVLPSACGSSSLIRRILTPGLDDEGLCQPAALLTEPLLQTGHNSYLRLGMKLTDLVPPVILLCITHISNAIFHLAYGQRLLCPRWHRNPPRGGRR